MFEAFIKTLLQLSHDLGYLGVFTLMTVESSFVPFPSELVIPPAAYLAAQGEMNIYLVVLFGILGSICGALINYFLARFLGRPLVYSLVETRPARLFLLNKSKVEKSEKYFLKYGKLSTFLGRLVPAVRQLISLPAGFVKMDLKYFVAFTSLGAGLWVIILALLGYFFGANQGMLDEYFAEIQLLIIIAVSILVLYVFWRLYKKNRLNKAKKKL